MSTKLVGILFVLIAIVAGAYYAVVMPGQSNTNMAVTPPAADTLPAVTEAAPSDLPGATGSIDDFSAGIDADMQASLAAVGALDTNLDATVNSVQSTGASTNLYDPSNI